MTDEPVWPAAVVLPPAAEYPAGYNRCPTCRAYIGAPCTATATAIVCGQTVGPPVQLDHPHRARKVRAGW